MTSSCFFTGFTYRQDASRNAVFGRQSLDESISLNFQETAPCVSLLSFSKASHSGNFHPGIDQPDGILKAAFTYGGEDYNYFQFSISVTGAPLGSYVALNASNQNTIPPISISRSEITATPYNRFINVNTLPAGFETSLLLSFWRNGKTLTGPVQLILDVSRVSPTKAKGAVPAPHHDGPDIYGQMPAKKMDIPISYLVGQARITLQP